jgi:hypothetical protein
MVEGCFWFSIEVNANADIKTAEKANSQRWRSATLVQLSLGSPANPFDVRETQNGAISSWVVNR